MMKSTLPLIDQRNNRHGFSLVEVIISMFVLTAVSGGIIAGMIKAIEFSDESINRTTAHSIAVGYGEQLMATEYETLLEAHQKRTELTLVSIPLLEIESNADIETPFKFRKRFYQDIVMHIDPDDPTQARKVMPMRFTIWAYDLNQGNDPVYALTLKIDYEFLHSGKSKANKNNWIKDQVHLVKSSSNIY